MEREEGEGLNLFLHAFASAKRSHHGDTNYPGCFDKSRECWRSSDRPESAAEKFEPEIPREGKSRPMIVMRRRSRTRRTGRVNRVGRMFCDGGRKDEAYEARERKRNMMVRTVLWA